MEKPTARVNAAKLETTLEGTTVRLIGKLSSVDGDTAEIESTDGATVLLTGIDKLENEFAGEWLEVIGRKTETGINVFTFTSWGSDVDADLANKVVELTRSFPDVFGVHNDEAEGGGF